MTGHLSCFLRAWNRRFVLTCCLLSSPALLAFEDQKPNPDVERELKAGLQAIERGDYGDAAKHFSQANDIRQGKCSECYVWLARLKAARGELDEAIHQVEQAASVADTGRQSSIAHLYRGVFLTQQGNLAGAEAALTAALAADQECVECAFNLGFVLLRESKDEAGVKVLRTIAPKFAGTPRGHEIERFIADPSRARKDLAPQFSARASNGQEINLDTLKGKVVLLDFWGTWCAPCRASLPLLKDLASKVDPANVAIVSIDEGDSRGNWEKFIRDNGMTWTQIYDGDLALHHSFRVDGYPRYYILSRDGVILSEFKGWKQDGEATISDAIARALQQ
jgi:thioredoxin-like negative regulator of GroEL